MLRGGSREERRMIGTGTCRSEFGLRHRRPSIAPNPHVQAIPVQARPPRSVISYSILSSLTLVQASLLSGSQGRTLRQNPRANSL
jgi:hypothetical protein